MTSPRPTALELSNRYAQVLLPIDFSPLSWRALPVANAMARRFGVPRRILHVDTASPWLDEGTNRLVLRTTPTGEPLDVEVIAAPNAAAGVISVLGDDEGSLLVMSTHGHTAAAEVAMGSTTEEILRRWHGSMLAIGPRLRTPMDPVTRIVVCAEPATALPVQLVQDVRSWAMRLQVPIEVLSVTTLAMAADFDYVRAVEQRLAAIADLLGFDDGPVRVERLEATREAHQIVRYAEAVPGTLLAMATHARPAAARLVLGSVAMSVLRHTTTPVLIRRYDRAAR